MKIAKIGQLTWDGCKKCLWYKEENLCGFTDTGGEMWQERVFLVEDDVVCGWFQTMEEE